MMFRIALVCGLVAGAAVQGSAQEPTRTLPDAYKLQLENDHVRVVRVHYAAGAKLPDHTHPAGTTVYVYLNGSEGVVFRHTGGSNRAVTRPAVKSGAVRIATGREEHHTAENPASTPSDFLRILLKTDGAGERTMYRLQPSEASFDNKQLRITRLTVAAGTPLTIGAPAGQPSVIVSVPSGETRWIAGGERAVVADPGSYIRIDLLTAPQSPASM
ncbi:MAG TPA: hypothetical protein VF239_04170 [Vicinamibacterales bacterium]